MMQIETIEAHWVESRRDYSVSDLAQLAGLPLSLLRDLVEHGALPDDAMHRAESVTLIRSVKRLRDDFDLDTNGLAVALSLLRRLHALERELAELRALAGG